jgi:hypothetical protein
LLSSADESVMIFSQISARKKEKKEPVLSGERGSVVGSRGGYMIAYTDTYL